jgi:hypothetical protein
MEQMLAVMASNPAAACAGLVAMACLGAWPLFRTRPVMLSVYVGNNLAFALHHGLLDHWTAVAMTSLMRCKPSRGIRPKALSALADRVCRADPSHGRRHPRDLARHTLASVGRRHDILDHRPHAG